MSNPISRQAVALAFGIQPDHQTPEVFKRLVGSGYLPAPLDAAYDQFDLTAVQAKLGTAAQAVVAAQQIAREHRGGAKAVGV